VNVALIDTYNLIHRAKSGFTKGEYAIVYNFFRGLRPIIEKVSPDKVYFVLEGYPTHRQEISGGTYKGNRNIQSDSFIRQKNQIINIAKECLPFNVMIAPDLECDDLIANLAEFHDRAGDKCTIVSGDSDFIQIFDTCNNVKIYHPIKKIYIEKPDFNYLSWKALRGDASDNIPGIKGVGDKTANKIMSSLSLFNETLSDPEKRKIFERNKSLIEFVKIQDFYPDMFLCSPPSNNIIKLKTAFETMGFSSMSKEKTWNKFADTFSNIK